MSTLTLDPIEVLSGSAAVAEGDAQLPGTSFRRPARNPRWNELFVEAADLYGRAMAGDKRAMLDMAEALTTSDFPILLGALFDRELLDQYQDITPTWTQYARRTVVRDFRPKKWTDLIGGRGILDPVPEATEYPARAVSEAEYELRVGKRGARIPLTWEDIVNDDLDAFRDLPNRLAVGARDTESYLAASTLVRASGANTDFFKSANGNAPTNLPLTLDNLSNALAAISQRKDPEGRPIVNVGTVLVVPPALELQALAILNTTEVRNTVGGQTTIQTNPLRGKVTLVVDPWLTVVATDAKAATRWFVLPAPNGGRPSLVLGFLRGHEAPDLRVKVDAGSRVGGGALGPEDGSFDDDTIQYRVRHVLGTATLDPIGTYASNGS